MRSADISGLTARKPKKTFQKMLNAIGDSLSEVASSDHGEDGEDIEYNEEDSEPGKASEDDKPGRVIGTITRPVQHRMERCRQKQMRLDQLTETQRVDAADYFPE